MTGALVELETTSCERAQRIKMAMVSGDWRFVDGLVNLMTLALSCLTGTLEKTAWNPLFQTLLDSLVLSILGETWL